MNPTIPTIEELKQLETARNLSRIKAIQISKRFKIIKKVYFNMKEDYQNIISIYNKADKKYAYAAFARSQKKQPTNQSTKPYQSTKRIAAKALKALENLPEELRAKIIADAQDGLF